MSLPNPDPNFSPTEPVADERLGRRHQLRVDITIALALVPAWLKRALVDRNDQKVRQARADIVERIASAIERRFCVTWIGADDPHDNALPVDTSGPLFGGPESRRSALVNNDGIDPSVDSAAREMEHKANI